MTEPMLLCPYCGGAVSHDTTICPDCTEDVAALAKLEYAHAIYYNEALVLAREGKPDEALAKLSTSIAVSDAFGPAHMLRAKILAQQGRWDQALSSAQTGAALMPDDEAAQDLALEVGRLAKETRVDRLKSREGAARERRLNAEQYFAAYQRDVAAAFVLGIGFACLIALVISWIGGSKRRSG